jgi:DNA repair exonuclease SbcCD ATPase subunit
VRERSRGRRTEVLTETAVSVEGSAASEPPPARARVREVVRSGARRLVEIGPDGWCVAAGAPAERFAGAIVRLVPPPEATDAEVAEVERQVRAAGAAAVRVAPRVAPGPGPVGRAAAEEAAAPARRSLSEVLEELVRGSRTEEPDALRELVARAVEEGTKAAPRVLVPTCSEPLWPVRLTLSNWYRFRGEHAVPLRAGACGVAARSEADPERSNWLGKSSLLTAIGFALFGSHTKARDDDWITDGEERGGVELELSDGSVVSRTRRRGSSTQIELRRPGQRSAHQAAANDAIAAHVGLSEADFAVVGHVRQKEVDLLVRAKPGPRLEMFSSWMPELALLREAEDWARRGLQARSDQEQDARREAVAAEARLKELACELAPGVDVDADGAVDAARRELAAMESRLREAAAAARGRAERLKGDAASLRGWAADATSARLGEEAEQDLREAEARLRGRDAEGARVATEAARRAAADTHATLRRASEDAQTKRRLASGSFDGRCPLVPIECPARSEINGRREQNEAAMREAEAELSRAARANDEAQSALARASGDERALQAELDRAATLKGDVARYAPARERIARDGAPPPDGQVEAEARRAWDAAIEAERAWSRAKQALPELAEAAERRESSRRRAEAAATAARLFREALAVVGRMGAQRAVAERELRAVELGANGVLASCGIDLRVALRWGRESPTGELASSCDACGAPCSGKARGCPRCGAERGPKVDPKVELELSDRSGAADDLGGLAVRIAAGAWLRDRRGSAWRGIVVDEPFGALDASNRRALASHIAAAVRSGGYRQALVVAHDAASMAALPERVTVVGLRDGSSRIEAPHSSREGGRDGAAAGDDGSGREAVRAERDPDVVEGAVDGSGDRRPRGRGGAEALASGRGEGRGGEAPRRRRPRSG